jgi:hypothetical protein
MAQIKIECVNTSDMAQNDIISWAVVECQRGECEDKCPTSGRQCCVAPDFDGTRAKLE